MKKFFRKYITLFLVVFLVLDALLIYFAFFGFTNRSKEFSLATSEESFIEKVNIEYDVLRKPNV